MPRSRTQSRKSSDLPNWEWVWLRHRNEILLPAYEDDAEFEKRLEVFKPKWRQEYEARKQELEDWRTKTIGQMTYLGGGRFYRELRNCKPASLSERVEGQMRLLEAIFTQPLSEFLGRLHGGYLNWTREVARHEPTIRNPVLQERWATKHHLKLAEMNADKEAFLHWYRAHYPIPSPPASNEVLERMSPGASAAIADDALCAEIRFVADFSDVSRVWLADCPRRDPLLTAEEQRPFEAPVPISTPAAPAERLEAIVPKLAAERQRLEAATHQLAAKTKALDEVIAPLNRLYSEVELAEIRKRAIGQNVPDLFVDWVMTRFQASHPPRLPTKGDAFNNCGPGTLIGEKLAAAGFGISKQRFADHLTVMRRLLVEKGWLAARDAGKSRKRESNFQPEDRLEDINQPSPAESAEDRDDERRKAAGLPAEEEDGEESDGDS